jgi:FkbH-like protein
MSAAVLTSIDLPWLTRMGPEWRKELAGIQVTDTLDWGLALRKLASNHIDVNQAITLAKLHDKLKQQGPSPTLTEFKLAILSTASPDFLKPLLIASALRHGISLEVVTGSFGDLLHQALDANSVVNASKPDAVLVAADYRGLPMRSGGDNSSLIANASQSRGLLDAVCAAIRRNCGAVCLVQNLPSSPIPLFGSLDTATQGTMRHEIAAINRHLTQTVGARGDLLLDLEWVVSAVGCDAWYDERLWNLGRMPCSQRAMPLYADFIARLIAAIRGKSRKCLVLDLDNTLWGGVIGDDGVDGIQLNIGDARGESFRAIQQTALDLSRRGVVLAVCSKNNEDLAREPFRKHPGMLLKESDIAVFMANWDDKASNLERIAKQLNLGIDSLVLLDDNPVERDQVRSALPTVAVPEVGTEPSRYPALLTMAGYFEAISFTREDALRAQEYRGNIQREQTFEASRNIDDFLKSLDLSIEMKPFSPSGRKRITQLINKTNQFNLTTKRYTEQQVEALESNLDNFTLQVSARDKFGDSGMISVLICQRTPQTWAIDSWLMSCRVFNRRIEHAIMNQLVAMAKNAGATSIIGSYVATDRNAVVKDLYSELGFSSTTNSESWVLDLSAYKPFDVAAQIVLA